LSGEAVLAGLRADGAGRHRAGVMLMLASTLAFSTAGFFSRAISLEAPAMMFWRGVFSGLTIGAFVAWERRGRLRATLAGMGTPELILAVLGATAMISFLWALRLSSVAEVSVIYATLPLMTAALGWVLLGERAGPAMLLAGAACFAGVVVMMQGGQARAHLFGDLFAALMTLVSALLMVALRRWRHRDNSPAICAAAVLTAVATACWAHPLLAAAPQIALTAAFGIVQNGLGLILMTIGARYVTATETALYGALDAPLAPMWVWLAFGEAPGPATLVGGAIVMVSVLGFIVRGER
jgi:drug/metabolite transporter (DMT)-like permease